MKRADGGKRRIMIIDDDEAFLESARQWLAPRYEVRAMRGGEKLLETLEAVVPDLLILDAWLPGHEGFALCRAVGLNKKWRSLPILLTIARERDSFYGKKKFAENKGTLSKPTTRRTLVAAIEALLGKGGA